MFVTKILDDREKDDYVIHQMVRSYFPGSQRVLFQRASGFIIIVSERPSDTAIKSKEFFDFNDDQYLFSIRLNPVIDRNDYPRKVTNLKEWVENKLTNGTGIKVQGLSYNTECRVSYKGSSKISLHSIFINGILTVIDSEKFTMTCQKGIGHGKGLGFGLLNIF